MIETKHIISDTFSSAQDVTGNFFNRTRGDKVIWAIVFLLTMVSILVVYSSIGSLAYKMNKTTESYLFRQVGYIFLGVVIIFAGVLMNLQIYFQATSFFATIAMIVLLAGGVGLIFRALAPHGQRDSES